MKYLIPITLSSLGFAYAAPADQQSDGYVSIDITAETGTLEGNSFTYFKRDKPNSYFETDLVNKVIYYSANVGVGTPPQNFSVTIDTGSSDFWIAGGDAIAPTYFNSSLSSSFHSNNTKFSITYVSGSSTGTWATEKVTLGKVSVSRLPFGDVTEGADLKGVLGVLGIGSMQNESPVILQTGDMYPNFPRKLKDQGHIHKVAYSLYLNNLNATSGSLLFGGVDKNKFSGSLYTVPIVSDRSLDVELTSMNIGGTNLDSWDASGITLDSGTSLTYLPADTVLQIGDNLVGPEFVGGMYFIDSTDFDWSQTIDFTFSGATIKVPVKNFSLKIKDVIKPGSGLDPKYDYVLGLLSNSNSRGINLLGDTFLRSAYVVYNIEDWEVSIAQASYDKSRPSIQPITSSVPFAIPAPNVSKSK